MGVRHSDCTVIAGKAGDSVSLGRFGSGVEFATSAREHCTPGFRRAFAAHNIVWFFLLSIG
jgi:hypothetical protein